MFIYYNSGVVNYWNNNLFVHSKQNYRRKLKISFLFQIYSVEEYKYLYKTTYINPPKNFAIISKVKLCEDAAIMKNIASKRYPISSSFLLPKVSHRNPHITALDIIPKEKYQH